MPSLFRSLLIFSLLAVLSQSCKQQDDIVVEEGYTLSIDSFAPFLENQFSKWTVLVCQDQLSYMDTIQSFYESRKYKSLWWKALLGDSLEWAQLVNTFAIANQHGMDYRYYYNPLVDYYRQKLTHFSTADSVYRLMAELEVLTSHGLLQMYEDIGNGRTNPRKVYGYTYMLPRNNLTKLDYYSFLESSNKPKQIADIHKNDTTYNELLKVMSFYLGKKEEAQRKAIDFSEHPKLEVGDSTPTIAEVISRLKERKLPDESIDTIADTAVYTKELALHIKKLQSKYNLTPDGIMGFKTYKVINASPVDKIDQVKANLERQRWFSKPNNPPYVYINLPEYKVTVNWPDSSISFKVCIGKNLPDNYDAMVKEYTDSGWLYKLPRNMETPQIASKITYMVINPTWTVPYSIVRDEMWWKMVRDSTYLRRKGYYVKYRGERIDADTIQWSKVNRNKIPYVIVQEPGRRNALGTVKYMFNNPFSIYLHDTPSKGAFRRTQRAVSHGCVRLEKPILFGEYLMQNSKKYDSDDFRIMMGYKPRSKERLKDYDPTDSTASVRKLEETTRVWLEKPMPLYLDYRTVYYDREWNLHFCYDIYDQNKLILQAMDKM